MGEWWTSNGFAYRVFDKYGCGESEGKWRHVTMDLLADQIVALVEDSAKESNLKIILVGHSEGSKLGFEVAARVEVAALVARVPSHQEIRDRMKYQLLDMSKNVGLWEKWSRGITMAMASKEKPDGFLADYPLSYWVSCLGRTQPGDLVRKIKAPIFVLNGGADPFTPELAYKPLHHAIAQRKIHGRSQAKVYAEVGHSLLKPGCSWKESEPAADILAWLQ